MVVGLHPGDQQAVELGQVGDAVGALAGELDQELAADGAEEPLDLAAALGRAGVECTRRMPRVAQARSSQESTNGEPLST